MKHDDAKDASAKVRQPSRFARDFRGAAIVAAVVCVLLMVTRTWINENNELAGPFSFLPAWPFYSRLGIPVIALAFAFAYSIVRSLVRRFRC